MDKLSVEYGSDFHYYYPPSSSTEPSLWERDGISLFFSGRAALYNLLAFGIAKYGWHKVGFPSYYCHEVVEFCKHLPIEIAYYPYNPIDNGKRIKWEDNAHSVFINVDYFGVKKLDMSFLKKTVVIDDLTHNLLSIEQSNADYCFGSLRKQLPVATGGFCFAGKGDFTSTIPESAFANHLAMQKLTAMWLKSAYLKGAFSQKAIFRKLYVEAEERFGLADTNSAMPNIVKTQLQTLSIPKLIAATYRNISEARTELKVAKGIRLLNENSTTAMGLVFVADNSDLKNRFKSFLIDEKIYPAVLWPHQFRDPDIDLEERILFVHTDFRYTAEDISHIIQTINKFIHNV